MRQANNRQKGAVLIVALVLLLLMSILGFSNMSNTVLQERVAGNLQESMSSFQAAETALRDGEDDVMINITASTIFFPSCSNGLCEQARTGYDVWLTTSSVYWDEADAASDVNTRTFGTATGVADLKNVSRQPAYIVERLYGVIEPGDSALVGTSDSSGAGSSNKWYRVTSVGFGGKGQSKTMVQSVVRR